MAFLIIFAFLSLVIYAFPQPAHAIVILPAVILIPIVKIVALLIGTLALPTTTLGALWSKLFNKSLKRTLAVIALFLLLLALISFVILKLLLPNHPLF